MRYRVLATAVAACLAAGCGGGLVSVTGTVTLDGKPVDEGSVSFQPADGNGPSGGAPVKDGRFEVTPGLKPGEYKVSVRAGLKTGRKIPAGPPHPAGSLVDEVISYPPPGKPVEPTTVEVKPDNPPLSFDLTSPAGKS